MEYFEDMAAGFKLITIYCSLQQSEEPAFWDPGRVFISAPVSKARETLWVND